MSTIHRLAQLIKADILERTRRYSFLVTVAATLYIGYLVNAGTVGVFLGKYRGVLTPAWTGMMMALCGIAFVALAGFYVVKNAIERDRETGVGQILASTSVSTTLYLLGKVLSNFAVLATVMCILALAAVILQVFRGETGALDLWALFSPFLLLSLPAMFFIGATAVFFECVPLLRGGVGNVLYFFVYAALLVPIQSATESTDVLGSEMALHEIQADLRLAHPDYNGVFSIGWNAGQQADRIPYRWNGMRWDLNVVRQRALPVAYGLILLFLASASFDRFASTSGRRARKRRVPGVAGRAAESRVRKLTAPIVTPLEGLLNRSLYGRLLLAELRLIVLGRAWWWYAVAAGLWIVSVSTEPPFARMNLLPFIWVCPIFLWSGMGTGEGRYRTGEILFSAPRPLERQLPATLGAGFTVALVLASGILLRLGLSGDWGALLSVAGGALFIPSLALTLGIWSGTSKTFEALYVVFWYVGPMQHTVSIDFMATTEGAVLAGTPVVFLAISVLLILAAVLGRRRQLVSA